MICEVDFQRPKQGRDVTVLAREPKKQFISTTTTSMSAVQSSQLKTVLPNAVVLTSIEPLPSSALSAQQQAVHKLPSTLTSLKNPKFLKMTPDELFSRYFHHVKNVK